MASISRARASRSARPTPRFSRPKVTLSRTVRQGRSACSWNTIAVSGEPGRSASMRTSPALWRSNPATTRRSVDLPLPLGPTMQRNSPASAWSEIRSRASTERPWLWKLTLISLTRTFGRREDIVVGVATALGEGRNGGPARARSAPRLLHRVDARLSDLSVLLRGDTGHADRTDDLPIVNDGDTAFEHAGPGDPQEPEVAAALLDEVGEHLRGPPKGDGGVGLLPRDLEASKLCAVHAMHHHEIAAGVQDGDTDVPLVLVRLGLGARHHLLGLLERDGRAVVGRWRRRGRRLLGRCRCQHRDQRRADDKGSEPCHFHASPPRDSVAWCASGIPPPRRVVKHPCLHRRTVFKTLGNAGRDQTLPGLNGSAPRGGTPS